jgi:prolyl-tRNA synthetase
MPYYTSHGVSTRMVGAIIVVHGDAKGIVLPPLLAPTQIAILTLFADKDPNVLNVSEKVQKELSKYYRVSIDNTSNSFGFKISNQEVLGTPISIVLGPKDVANNIATVIRRDTGEKITVSLDQLTKTIQELITSYSTSLYNKALSNLNSSIVKVDTLDEFKKVISENKIALAP